MARQFIGNVKPYVDLYRDDRTGIAWVVDGSTGMGHSCHASIDASGSVRGMKKLGYWGKKDRVRRSNGLNYNIDTFVVSDELDEIAAEYCNCEACLERRAKV